MFPAEDMLSFQLLSLETPHPRLPFPLRTPPASFNHLHSRNSPGSDDSVLPLAPPIDLASTTRCGSSVHDDGKVLYKTFNSQGSRPLDPFNAFSASRSRVIRVDNFRSLSASIIAGLLHQEGASPSPMTIWALREDYTATEDGRILYCVYRTHEQAYEILSLPPSRLFSTAPVSESDLEPFHKLRRVELKQISSALSAPAESPISPRHMFSPVTSLPPPSPCKLAGANTIRQSSSLSDLREPTRLFREASIGCVPGRVPFPISSNPPNAKTNFRLGDWICKSPVCGAHNFGRNVVCIGCGSSRPTSIPGHFGQIQPAVVVLPPRFPSPRFASVKPLCPNSPDSAQCPVPQRRLSSVHISETNTSTSSFPILTPSGKQLSVGGKVQNISMNPLAPCFMFWSFNEPLPHPGQIRPTMSALLQHPPILNTGNRGPIEHQPGDWICHKCNYLNWRRRKVCQTCFPYAEGNGDSVSTAVQAERIALLAGVLSSESSVISTSGRDSHSLPPSPTPSFSSGVMPPLVAGAVNTRYSTLSRSRSHADLFQNNQGVERPIYQTSVSGGYLSTPGPLLPAFLQDIVHSPSLSPASSASADCSLEDYDEVELPHSLRHPHPLSRKTSSSLTAYSIWKLDGEEARALCGQPQEDL